MGRRRGRRAGAAASEQDAWDVGETPEFVLDMRNQGENAQRQCRVPNFCEIEWDGQWYRFGGAGDLDCKAFFLNPGKQIDDWVKVSLDIPVGPQKGRQGRALAGFARQALRARRLSVSTAAADWDARASP